MKAKELSQLKETAAAAKRLAALEEENANLALTDAKLRGEIATLRRQVISMERAEADQRERLRWIATLASTRIRPGGLPDSMPEER